MCKCMLACLCFFGLSAQAQTPSSMEELAQKYADYFEMEREAVFLHLNKTAVAPGENIWFAAYVYSPKFLIPGVSTTNLHVNLYNAEGMLKEAKTIFVQNGVGTGFFKVDSLPSGKYSVKASTKYMENFPENLSFSQSFTILGETGQEPVPIAYDLQLLPEGGHLVADIRNTVGVKLIDNSGKGVFFTNGKVLNSKNETINTFKGNKFGLSKFSFVPVSGEEYHVVLTPFSGNPLSQKMPESNLMGLAMTANLQPDKVVFSFKTNPKTFENLQGKTFYMALHKEGVMKIIGFVVPETLEAVIPIPKSNLAAGINTVTIFNEKFRPILERMVFNRKEIERKSVAAKFVRRDRDSLVFNLSSKDSMGFHSMSISVLPVGTKSYQPKNDIFSAFYIEPYIRGELENGHYYFSDKVDKRRRDYDLDLLLLTQGWSKYSWQNVFNHTPTEMFQREVGFSILGKINNWNPKKQNQVFLKSMESNLFSLVNLRSDGTFELDSLFVLNNEKIGIALLKERNNNVSKTEGYLRVLPAKDIQNTERAPQGIFVKEEKQDLELTLPESFLKEEVVAIDSVLIEAQTKRKELEKNLMAGEKLISITEELGFSFLYLSDLIAFHGFDVKRTMGNVIIHSRRSMNLKGAMHPTIYLNGFPLYDNRPLFNLLTKEVEWLIINKTFMGPRLMNGGGGTIRIQTKTGYSKHEKNIEDALIVQALNGFASKKEFYAPKYSSYTSDYFAEYGVIDWFPNFSLNDAGQGKIKVFNTLQPEINLYIEGMALDGALISETISLRTN